MFDRYNDYIVLFENVLRARNYAKSNNFDNLTYYINEARVAEGVKEKFDKCLIDEINTFNNLYTNTLANLINEFKAIIIELNSNVIHF